MQDLKEIRFVATNFYNLQGLRAVSLGLCLVSVCFWANVLQYPTVWSDFLVPLLCIIGMVILLLAINRYYLHTFGRVQRTPESRRFEWLVSTVGGVLALGAFWLDVSFRFPVSLLGLTFAAGLLVDYIRMTWLVNGRYLIYYPLGAILIAGVSVLPLFGDLIWWKACGLRTQILGIAMLIGLFSIIAGIGGHLFLVRTLSNRADKNDHSI